LVERPCPTSWDIDIEHNIDRYTYRGLRAIRWANFEFEAELLSKLHANNA